MMKQLVAFVLILLHSHFPCQAQQDFSEKILGVWELVHRESLGIEVMPDGVEIVPFVENVPQGEESDIILYFQREGTVDIVSQQKQIHQPFELKDSTLRIAGVECDLIKLTDDSLIIAGFDDMNKYASFYYLRSDKKVIPASDSEWINVIDNNGNTVISGLEENGLKSGVWIEWYEEGPVRFVNLWFNGMSVMKVEFSKEGEVIERIWYDVNTEEFRRY